MIDTSFYGGRRGTSFIITEKYGSIQEMIKMFSQGGGYRTVNYGDYVIIDTENKNDKDNGKIYCRGNAYNNEVGGAIYVGQIVGPSGPAPHLEVKTSKEIDNIADIEGFDYRRGNGSLKMVEDLLPGKYLENGIEKFNDEIKWNYCSVRDVNSQESTVYIGFKIPYDIIEIEAESIDAYYNRDNNTDNFTNLDLIQRIDDLSHPFYSKWKIKIPKGIKGNSFRNLRVMTADNTIEDYDGQKDDIQNQREVLVYDYWVFDKVKEGEKKTLYVGDYNEVENVTITEQGKITITYSHDDSKSFQLKIPISVEIQTGETEGSGNQKLLVRYSDGSSKEIGYPINYIIRTAINDSYHLLALYADPAKRGTTIWDDREDWVDLGYIGNGTGVGAIIGKESDTGVAEIANTLPPYSAWLVIEE